MSGQKLHIAIRLSHWLVALIVLLNGFILEEGKTLHRYFGYTIVGIVVLRLLFSLKVKVDHYNPKAKYVYFGIWALIIGLGVTGILMGLDRFFGNQTLEDIHETLFNLLSVLVLVHLGGVFFDAYRKKRRTWMVMFTGKRE